MKKQAKFKRWVDVIVKCVTCIAFFITLGVECKTFLATIILKVISCAILLVNMYLIDEYGRI